MGRNSNSRAASSFFFFFLLLLPFLFAVLPCWKPAAAAAASPGRSTAVCNETEGGGRRCSRVEVEEDAEEFQFDSEINRRLLAGTGPPGVGYKAENKGKSVCTANMAGGQYKNCGGKTNNMINRGCSVTHYCRNNNPP